MAKKAQLQHFVHRWKVKINRNRLLHSLSGGVLVMAIGAVIVCIAFVWRGHAVSPLWFLLPGSLGLVEILVMYPLLRLRDDRAAHHADGTFQLKQGLTSACFFAGQGLHDGIYHLQAEHTARQTHKIDLDNMRLPKPWRKTAATCIIIALMVWLCTFNDSPAVTEQKAEAKLTEAKTTEIKKHLQQAVEELKQQLSDAEQKLFEKSELAEIVDELQATPNRKEALRQYARIEKKLRDYSVKLSTKRDEKFAAQMGRQLQKGKETKELAQKMLEKKYRQAGAVLKKFSQKSGKGLQNARKDLDKLRSATNRMEAACRESGDSKSDLKNQTSKLCEQANQLQQALQQAEQSDCKDGKFKGEKIAYKNGQYDGKKPGQLSEFQLGANERLASLSKSLNELDARKIFLRRLDEMRKNLGQCQRYMVSSQYMLASQKGIGKAPDGRMDNSTSERTDQAQATQVNPLLGAGPSQIAIEDAESGTGTARVGRAARKELFRTQVEALVRREDVPADLKDGVKSYFEIIHKDGQKRP